MGFSRNVFTTTKKNPGSLGARIIYAQIRYSSITPLLAEPRSSRRTLFFFVHTCVRTCVPACMRVCARACRRWCTGRWESAWSTGYHPRVKGRVSRKRKKRGRGRWAWFVFEVESTLHLLFPSFEGGAHRPSRITLSESIANSKEIPILSRHSRVAILNGSIFISSGFINSRELIGALSEFGFRARCPNRKKA